MVAQHSAKSIGQTAFRLSQKDIKINKTTLRRIFKEAGVHLMKQLLTSDDILKRYPSRI